MFETTKVVRVADVAVGCRLLLGIRVDDHPHDADDDADDANNDAASISSRSLPKNDSRDDALTLAVAAMGAMMMMDAAAAADTTAGILFGYSKQ